MNRIEEGVKDEKRRVGPSGNCQLKGGTPPQYCSWITFSTRREWAIDHVEHRRRDRITATCRYFSSHRYLSVCLSVHLSVCYLRVLSPLLACLVLSTSVLAVIYRACLLICAGRGLLGDLYLRCSTRAANERVALIDGPVSN